MQPPPLPSLRKIAPQNQALDQFPCEQCGADYRFDPHSHKMLCDHCGHEKDFELDSPWHAKVREINLIPAQTANGKAPEIEEIHLFSCPNCAAKVTFERNNHARECPFCATPVVADTRSHKQYKPGAVLPFSIDEKSAKAAMKDWLGTLWFAPNGLKKYARQGRKLKGIYVPYWTFDADTDTDYNGERGTVYYETRTVQRDGETKNETVQRIRWSPKSGRIQRWFDDVLILASKSLPAQHTKALEPWNLSDLEPYSSAYLSGFHSESYGISRDEAYDVARDKMLEVIRRDVRFDIGGDRQKIHQMEASFSNVTFKHILLPVWLAAYSFRDKTYRFVVNGQTGRVQGERPWSTWKIVFFGIVMLTLTAALVYAASYLEHS